MKSVIAGRGLNTAATTAAVAAVVTVLLAGAVAGVRFTQRDAAAADPGVSSESPDIDYPSGPSLTPSAFEGGRIISGDAAKNAYYEIPSERDGWAYRQGMKLGLQVTSSYVGLLPFIYGAAYYDQGWCGTTALPIGRAYVGFAAPIRSSDVARANRRVLDGWVDGVAFDEPKGHSPQVQAPHRIELPDGTEAWVSSVRSTVHNQSCDSHTLDVTVLSIDTGTHVASVIAHRYLGTGADLSDADMMRVLTTLRRQLPG